MSNAFDFGNTNIALALDVAFPSNVYAGPGIAIDKTGVNWTIGLGYPPLSENLHVTPTNNYYLAVYDVAQNLYEKVRLDNLISGATGLDTRTPMGDADYIALPTDRYIAIATPLTLNRTLSLPPASSVPGGREISVQDEIGTLNASHYLVVHVTGTDTIDGKSQRILSTPYGGLRFRSNGTNAWNVVATTSLTPVNNSGYTCNPDDKVIAYTAITAARTVTLPLAANYPPGQRLTVMDQVGACTATITLTVLPQGGDLINGLSSSPVLTTAHAFLGFVSDGVSRWSIVDNVGGGGATTVTASQITDASPLGRLLITQTTAAQDRASLGSQSTGDAMFLAATPAGGRAVLGSGTVGDQVFISNTTGAAGTALGLGTMAYQNSSSVNITGGTITGVAGLGGAGVTISDTPPGSPTAGALWFDSIGSQLYVWYNDGTSSQWVIATNQNLSGTYLPLTGGTLTGPLTVPSVVTPSLKATSSVGALRGHLWGCGLSNDTTSPNTVLDTATGICTSDDGLVVMACPAINKSLASNWAVGNGNGGLDTGAMAASKTYHVFVIERPDTGVVDVLLSLSPTAPTMPANYTLKRRIGAILTNASNVIYPFAQRGDVFYLSPANFSYNTQPSVGAPLTIALMVPGGVTVEAIFDVYLASTGTVTSPYITISSLLVTADTHVSMQTIGANTVSTNTMVHLLTDNASIRLQLFGTVGPTVNIYTIGWVDRRGRDN